MEKQLNVWIDETLKEELIERAQQKKKPMKEFIEAILVAEMARQKGALLEEQSLPIIRDIVQVEVRRGLAQLRVDLREDAQIQTQEITHVLHHLIDRVMSTINPLFRDVRIILRLVHNLIAKLHGADFAQALYQNAVRKYKQELQSLEEIPQEA